MNRNMIVMIFLTVVSCGLYGLYWMVRLDDDLNNINGTAHNAKGIKLCILGVCTCGIYYAVWAYKMGKISEDIRTSIGETQGMSHILYPILALTGIGNVVNCILMQSTINSIVSDQGYTIIEDENY